MLNLRNTNNIDESNNAENISLPKTLDELLTLNSVVDNKEDIQEPETKKVDNINLNLTNELENTISENTDIITTTTVEDIIEEPTPNLEFENIEKDIIENIDDVKNSKDTIKEDISIVKTAEDIVEETIEDSIEDKVENILEEKIESIIEENVEDNIEDINIVEDITPLVEDTDTTVVLENINNDNSIFTQVKKAITIENEHINNDSTPEVEQVSKEHINNIKQEAYTYASKVENEERKIVKKGLFSFIKRNNKLPQEELIDEEECEPVSQILSIG